MRAVFRALADELAATLRDPGALLILVVGTIGYAFFYPTPYLNQVLRKVPVAAVDLDRSALSRQLVRMVDAHPSTAVAFVTGNRSEAERRVMDGEALGILVIPEGFEKRVHRGEPVTVSAFADATWFLVYQAGATGMLEAAATLGAGIEVARLEASGMTRRQALAFRDPAPLLVRPLFNPAEGYASYVVPAVLVLILQQTMLLGIGLRRPLPLGARTGSGTSLSAAAAAVLGRGLAFFGLQLLGTLFYLVVVFRVFGFAERGRAATVLPFLVPFLLATAFLGLWLTTLFRRRESAMQVLLFTSLPAVFLAGFAWPREALPRWLDLVSLLLPSTSAIPGFLRVNEMGASLAQVRPEWGALWALSLLYFLLATLAQHRTWRR